MKDPYLDGSQYTQPHLVDEHDEVSQFFGSTSERSRDLEAIYAEDNQQERELHSPSPASKSDRTSVDGMDPVFANVLPSLYLPMARPLLIMPEVLYARQF